MIPTKRSATGPGRRRSRPGPGSGPAKASRAFISALAALLALAPIALAGPPTHPPLPDPINGFPLDHACGTAVDSEGDIYVSNAGKSKVEVFDPNGSHLTSIEVEPGEPREPCGLAVDTEGSLYVSERATGKVVRYTPNVYPFSGVPIYGAPMTIDGSGNAKGISVDPFDDRLYVAEGGRISVYDSEGNLGINEVQRVLVFEATGGEFKLCFEEACTGDLSWDATHTEVQAALAGLSTIGTGNVSVAQGPNESNPRDHLVTFEGPLAATDLPSITADTSKLIGGENPLLIFEYVKGFSGHIGEGNLTDAAGVAAYTYRIGGAQADRYLSAADAASDEVKIFSAPSLLALKLRRTITGPSAGEEFGFGGAGAYLAADSSNGHFFVYDDAHSQLDEFEAAGELLDQVESAEFADAAPTGLAVLPDRNEIQRVEASCTGGTFTLGFESETTAPIPCKATAAQVEEALVGLASIGTEDVSVFAVSNRYLITFQGALGSRDVAELEADDSGLTGGGATVGILLEAQGSGPGRLFVTAGAGPGARLLAFGPLAAPSRPLLEELSEDINGEEELKTARAVAVDKAGNVYVAAGSLVHVFSPAGNEIEVGPNGEGIPIKEPPTADLAVDSACNVYVMVNKEIGEDKASLEKQKVQYYSTLGGACPPEDGTEYSNVPVTVADGNSFETSSQMRAFGLNPANDHMFITGGRSDASVELDSAGPGRESKILDPCFACSLGSGGTSGIAVYGRNGNVYLATNYSDIKIVDPTGSEVLARIAGAGSPAGQFSGTANDIDVDQSNGHVLVFNTGRGAGEEYDSAGAFVSAFGEFTLASAPAGIVIDNSGGPGEGNVYVAYDDTAPETFDLTAFGPLSYGEAPDAQTGIASGIGGGEATLNGTVDPRGFEVSTCAFEYLSDAEFEAQIEAAEAEGHEEARAEGYGFEGASAVPCAEGPGEIGQGTGAVPVHAAIGGIDPEATRYRFRLIAENKYGRSGEGQAGLFGPPLLEPQSALPVLYDEATLRARIDPSGLATGYRFDYVTQEHFEAQGFEGAQSTADVELAPGEGFTPIEAPLTGLADGTTYRFRLVVENEAASAQGPDQALTTLERLKGPPCPNGEYRTGLSAGLPECRAYELVTPAETRGGLLYVPDPGTFAGTFNMWVTKPRGEGAGERLVFGSLNTLPGFEGTGSEGDTYRAQRAPGAHPEAGWSTELFSPTFADNGGETAKSSGIAEEQRYGFFGVSGQGALPHGEYLQTPAGLEPLGRGSLATDMEAHGRFIGPGGAHVVFSSEEHLEPKAAPQGTESLYDRAAASSSSEVVSVRPDGSAFGAGEDAQYVASTEDGSGVLFGVAGALYLHHAGATTQIATTTNSFAGVSPDASRVYYAADYFGSEPSDLFACDTQAGACVGTEAPGRTLIAEEAIFFHVSPGGSQVFFTSEEALPGAEENEAGETAQAGEPNLYGWDGASTRFIAVLDPVDGGLGNWTTASKGANEPGRNSSPTRSTPDGEVLVFQSRARLTAYDNEGATEIYRYDSGAPAGEAILCVSCDPSGAPPRTDVQLLAFEVGASAAYFGLVPNVTDDGQAVFFQSFDRLLPEDANEAQDVYEWLARGRGGCKRPGGCLGLISSGQGERASYLYGMSADGRDVFFATPEKLVAQDISGSHSLYDARVEGGIPDPVEPAPCQGDACQGAGTIPPVLPNPASATLGEGGNTSGEEGKRRRCAKGKRRVVRKGRPRCVKRQAKRRHSSRKHRRAKHNRGGRR